MVEFVIYCALIENLFRQLFTNLKNNLVRQYDSMYIQLVNVVFQDGDNFCKAFALVIEPYFLRLSFCVNSCHLDQFDSSYFGVHIIVIWVFQGTNSKFERFLA